MNRFIQASLLTLLIIVGRGALAQTDTMGLFSNHMDIGNPKNKGNAQYDKVTHTYLLQRSGYNI